MPLKSGVEIYQSITINASPGQPLLLDDLTFRLTFVRFHCVHEGLIRVSLALLPLKIALNMQEQSIEPPTAN